MRAELSAGTRDEPPTGRGGGARCDARRGGRVAIIVALVVAYVCLALYFHLREQRHTVYVHFAYLPIVLAATWWGFRGTIVALVQALLLLGLRLGGIGIGDPWSDIVRVAFMLGIGGVVAGLAERARTASRALELSRESYRTLFEKSLAGVWVYRDERIILANELLGTMLGYRSEDLVGASIWTIIHPDDRAAVRERLKRRESGESPDLHYECRLARKDGSWLWVDQASSLARYEDAPAVIVSSYDITSRKEAVSRGVELRELALRQEEQLVHSTRLAELGEMAAAVAHELNQPLTGIRNFADNAVYMLDNAAGEPGEVRENLGRISEQVDRAARIIGQMRQLARRTERQLVPLDLNTVVSEALEFLRPQMGLSGVVVETSLERGMDEVLGDKIRLEQVFLNLMTNARQAMEGAAVRVLRVETRQEGPRGPVVAVVSDTGAGFSAETGKRIFDPFFTTKKPGHGTGLGLSISLNIVKDHDGTIAVASEPGKGTTFTVKLPPRPEASRPHHGEARHDG